MAYISGYTVTSKLSDLDNTTKEYSPTNAFILCEVAMLAYLEPDEYRDELKRMGITDPEIWVTPVHFRSFQGFVCNYDQTIIISIRGSEQLDDWFVNIDCDLGPMLSGLQPSPKVHKGWYKGATQLFIDVVKEIEKYDPGKTKSVWLTGHSLGGAVAALLAAELALRNRAYKVFNGVYTYGQPRVADPSTAKAFDKRWPSKFFRIVNKGDDACDFPFVGDKYKHFGEPHIFDTTGTVPNFFSHLLQLEFNQMMAQTTSHHPLRYLTALKQ